MQTIILRQDPDAVDQVLYQLTADEGMMLCNLNVCLKTVNTYSPDAWFEVPESTAVAIEKAQETDYLDALSSLGVDV